MTCQELDRFLHPYLDGEFQAEESLDFEGHLSTCPDCARRVHQEAAAKALVRRAAQQALLHERAPLHLRAGIAGGLGREVRGAQQRVWLRAGAMMAVMVATGTTWVLLQPAARERFVEDAARRHAKRLPYEIAQASHEGVEAWFGGKLDHRVPVPRLPRATLAGARLSNITDRPAAYISYEAARPGAQGAPRHIGVFVFDDARRDVKAQPLPVVQVDSSHGYNVAVWRDGEIVYELVSDLDEQDIRRMLLEPQQESERALAATPALPSVPQVSVQPVSLQP